MVELSSDWFFRILLHRYSRWVLAAVAGIWVGGLLTERGWLWWAWLPAVILTVQAVYAVLLVAAYAYHKATYQLRARLTRERLLAAQENAGETSQSTQEPSAR